VFPYLIATSVFMVAFQSAGLLHLYSLLPKSEKFWQWLQNCPWIFKFETYSTTSCNVTVMHEENAVGLVEMYCSKCKR